MDDPLLTNRQAWDEWAAIHVRESSSYNLQDFKAGKSGWEPNVPDPLGSVNGKSLLHLQCHFGMDTLMWARQGAEVTGVDFSPVAIEQARKLASELGMNTTFVESEIADLPQVLSGQFDLVLTYYGTITWLPDLKAWGRTIAHFLKPGGVFYLADTHPVAMMYEVGKGDDQPNLVFRYFTGGKPERCQAGTGTYADPAAETKHKVTYQWLHNLQTIIDALLSAGLQLEYLHEFPYAFYNLFYSENQALMQQGADGWWRMKDRDGQLPLMFSVQATKPKQGCDPRPSPFFPQMR